MKTDWRHLKLGQIIHLTCYGNHGDTGGWWVVVEGRINQDTNLAGRLLIGEPIPSVGGSYQLPDNDSRIVTIDATDEFTAPAEADIPDEVWAALAKWRMGQ